MVIQEIGIPWIGLDVDVRRPATAHAGSAGPDRVIRAVPFLVGAPTPGEGYVHWDKLRHFTSPDGLSHEGWWLGIKVGRLIGRSTIPLTDRAGAQFMDRND